MADEVVKKDNGTAVDTAKRVRFGPQTSALHNRVAQAATKAEQENAQTATMPNRIAVILDDSGSMAGDKVVCAAQAGQGFLDACDASTTAVCVHTLNKTITIPLTRQFPLAAIEVGQLRATGGTPLGYTMEEVLMTESITHEVLVSDGQPDSVQKCYDTAHQYREAGIKVDCVHIGNDSGGEECLAKIAQITGGLYIKFDNVENFAKNFKFLTPRYRAQLADKASAVRLLGAKEVR